MKFDLQRADFWKRISALLLDIFVLISVVILIATLLSYAFGLEEKVDIIEAREEKYAAEYPDLDTSLTQEEILELPEEVQARYKERDEKRARDVVLIQTYSIVVSTVLTVILSSVLLGFIITELLIPIFFKNGQTLGKKAFGLGVIHTNGVRLHGQAHFIRSIVGKCAIETVFPLLICMLIILAAFGIEINFYGIPANPGLPGLLIILFMFILELYSVIRSRTRSTIHDLISDTVVVDLSSQMVFETVDDLMAYKTRIHAEEVSKKEY